jgi:hypothetical protein
VLTNPACGSIAGIPEFKVWIMGIEKSPASSNRALNSRFGERLK